MQRNTGSCKSLVMTKAIDGDSNTNNKKNSEDDEVCMNVYPWPTRCYICGFCKREFKSAQALGGHMNVHRKDRARLRSSPPADWIGQYTHSTILNLNLKPNPNPTFVPSPPPSPPSPFSTASTRQQLSPITTSFSSVPSWTLQSSHPPPTFSLPSATCHTENMKWLVGGKLSGPSLNLKSFDLSSQMKINAQSQEDGCMRLDLEIGVLGLPLSPETSSDEERDENSGTAKRSYECTFCKQGFTNAQALGGHMNIHRKDRAKAKQLSNQYRSNEDYISMSASQFSAPIYTQPASGYYPVLGHHEHHVQRNYHQMCYQPSESSPRFYSSMDDDSMSSQSSVSHHVNQELWGANLSLRFSPAGRMEDDDFRMGVRNHEEVDLELRLGHGGF
ncbi:hypothetical protein ACLB2K_040891 [Fragaria x ananassa]